MGPLVHVVPSIPHPAFRAQDSLPSTRVSHAAGAVYGMAPCRRRIAPWTTKVIMAERLAGGNQAIALLGNTIPTGAILVVIITIFAPVSGAHFNPAVTLVFAAPRETPWGRCSPSLRPSPNR